MKMKKLKRAAAVIFAAAFALTLIPVMSAKADRVGTSVNFGQLYTRADTLEEAVGGRNANSWYDITVVEAGRLTLTVDFGNYGQNYGGAIYLFTKYADNGSINSNSILYERHNILGIDSKTLLVSPGLYHVNIIRERNWADLHSEKDISDYKFMVTFEPPKGIPMFRMYNGNSGEHFYTKDESERDNLIYNGWTYEGVGWTAPEFGDPVYRVYNPNSGLHHYTTNEAERMNLISLGWKDEEIGWLTADSSGAPVYRQYNPNNGQHNYTPDVEERDLLLSLGWVDEKIGWYGMKTE